MSDRLNDFGRDVGVVLVTFTDVDSLTEYLDTHDLPFPVIIDAERTSYRSYGLGRGSFRRVWGLRTLRRYRQIARTGLGSRLRLPTEDARQLGGDFVIAPNGNLAWGRWSEGPDDRPSVDDLVTAVERCRSL